MGCGRVAKHHHGPILARISDAQVTAIIDPDPQARKAMVRLHPGSTFYTDLARPLALGEFDALVICAPPAHHAAAAIAGLDAGVHVYVEKPIAMTLDDADRMIAAATASDRVAMVGHNFRMHPRYRAVRAALERGDLGALLAVRTLFTSEKRELPGWKSTPDGGGDAITDLAVHHFDIISYLTDTTIEPGSITANTIGGAGGSLAQVNGRLETGQPVSITVGQITGQNAHRIELLCEAGHLEIDLFGNADPILSRPAHRMSRRARLGQRLGMARDALDIRHRPDPSFEAALRSFVHAASGANGQAVNEMPLEIGRRALDLALRAKAAAATKETP